MDPVTSVTIITLGASAIAAVVSLVKHFKPGDKEWVADVESVRKEIESHKINTMHKIAELENKMVLLGMDAVKIDEIKTWLGRLEQSIDSETTKLEDKIDKLLQLIIELTRKK